MRDLRTHVLAVLNRPGWDIGMQALVNALSAPPSAVRSVVRALERDRLVERYRPIDEDGKPGNHRFVRPKPRPVV